jgi:hypothetical protein
MLHLRYYGCAIALIVAVSFGGCSSSSNPPTAVVVIPPLPPGTYAYQLHVANLRALNTSSGRYLLWLQFLADSSWYSLPLGSSKFSRDSLDFTDTFKFPHATDSIRNAVVSIESSVVPATPTNILMTGTFNASTGSALLSAANTGGVGNYALAQTTVTFTTKSSDTNLAKNEFYLMRFVHGVPEASSANMPVAPLGWSYGLWVLDSNFYPLHQFFYGAFTNPDSADTNPTNNDYPFPGGYNPAPLNDAGAKLEVTLEPTFTVAGNKPAGPSPLIILSGQLSEFIGLGDTLALQNVWSSSAPSGILTIH